MRRTVLLALVLLVAAPAGAQASGRHHRDRDKDRCEEDCARSGDGDRKNNRYCFMPCDFVIIVPMPTPPGGGQPGPEESALPPLDPRCMPFHCDPKPAALFPPDPAKLTELIQAFASGIGKSTGDLAGAIAAFPPALLLST